MCRGSAETLLMLPYGCCALSATFMSDPSRLAGGVVLIILAAIDAAFSGDWSRIGVLSKDTELGLQSLLGLLGLFHIACGSVTALDAAQKGYNPVPQTLKAGPFSSQDGQCLMDQVYCMFWCIKMPCTTCKG